MAKVTVKYNDENLYGESLKEDIQKAAERIFADGLFLILEGALVKIKVDLEQ